MSEPTEILRAGLATWWVSHLDDALEPLGAFAVGNLGSPKSKPAEARAGSACIVRFGNARLTGTSDRSRYHVCPVTFEVYGSAQGEAASNGAPLHELLVGMESDSAEIFELQTGSSITGVRVGGTRYVQLAELRWRVEYDVRFTLQTSRG